MRSLEATWALEGSLWNIQIVSGDGVNLRLDLFTERLEGPAESGPIDVSGPALEEIRTHGFTGAPS